MSAPYQLIQVKRIADQTSTFADYEQTIPEYGELVFSHTNSVDELVVGDGTRALSSLPRLRVHILNLIQANPNLQINLGSTQAASVFQSNPRPGVTGTLPIANGGTGATTAAGIREAIGLGSTTGPIPVASGGTGATTPEGARSSLGLGTAATYNVATSVVDNTNIPTNSAVISYIQGLNYSTTTGTVTSVRVQATSPVTSSQSTAQATTLNTTIALADAYGDTKNPYGTKTANYVLAGPVSGTAAVPSFRTLAAADIPSLDAGKITTGTLPVARGGTGSSSAAAARTNLGVPRITYGTSAPSSDNHTGDLYINSSTKVLQVYTGSNGWANVYGVWG